MRPLTVITAIILGSCFAISVCLIAVWILLSLVSTDPAITDRVADELKRLPTHITLFIPLTAIAAMAFITSQKQKSSWWAWQLGLWISLTFVGFYYMQSMTS